MTKFYIPRNDSFVETLETYSEDAYIFSAPETID